MKYRKKPIVVDAVEYRPGMQDGWTLPGGSVISYDTSTKDHTLEDHYPRWIPFLDTPEGKMDISKGDMIITGIKGERYICKRDIFDLTYEPC